MELTTPISQLGRVGVTAARYLRHLGIVTVQDLLYHFPFRYEDFRQLVPIAKLTPGVPATVRARVELIGNRRGWRRRRNLTEALVRDASGTLRVIWFNQPFLTKLIKPGDVLYLAGALKTDPLGPQLVSPVFERDTGREATHTARLVPIYPLTAGLTQKQLRTLVRAALPLAKTLPDWLPREGQGKYKLIALPAALAGIHFPKNEAELAASTRRLKFDELLLVQLGAELARQQQQGRRAPAIPFAASPIRALVNRLPFRLTPPQKIAAWEILQGLGRATPMNRLLSGDVGSGKTVVAALALYNATLSGFQGGLLAPTEILAEQHFASLVLLLGAEVPLALLTANVRLRHAPGRGAAAVPLSKLHAQIADGAIAIVVGTHALLTETVHFRRLGLVVVDEQHRFGVEQRRVMREKGQGAHFLSMTATPIPRSLALLLYGDLDLSVIDELPPGRKPVLTRLVEPGKREKAYEFIRQQVKVGRQVFVVCPLIEEEKVNAERKSVLSEYKKLSEVIFPDLRVGYLHGKMKAKEKEAVMNKFKSRALDILVSTSVVEVGVDIPNASVMMIEGAESFGLAQLHQFRGRVGRAAHQSYCLLFTTEAVGGSAGERLHYFEAHHDGFRLAEKDLELRGPGEVYGTEQSGMMQLRLATLADRELIRQAREAAREFAAALDRYPTVAARVARWRQGVHWE
ncbi:MAG: ATP-dependent DNA helicase RecG [Candidatus Magasanikbacteria bacterium]|nr:ATP-dependent DNA helicase RecG [Candidatus Magasanikbacteria bacterium]